MMHCEVCGKSATHKRKFHDPRREEGELVAYVEKYLCDDPDCERGFIDELDRQAHFARLVH